MVGDVFISGRQQIWEYALSGTTTMADGSVLYAVFHQDDGETLPYSSTLREVILPMSNPRSFEFSADVSGGWPPDLDEFTVDIWNISRIGEEDVTGAALVDSGIRLAQVDGAVPLREPKDPRTLQNHDLSGAVTLNQDDDGTNRSRRVGKQRVSVP